MRYLAIILVLAVLFSCKKESFNNAQDALLFVSADTLRFDTVFTRTGSTSLLFKVINGNKEKLLLSSIQLMGGSASPFRLNIDGNAASSVSNIEMAPGDSLYVFATVTINPNDSLLPFIVKDSVQIVWNGNRKYVQLEAFGQNAIYLSNYKVTGNEIFTSRLPYVVQGPLTIDSAALLQIEAGSRLYFSATAAVHIKGTLSVNGHPGTSVLFAGIRRDEFYRDIPGSWPGLCFYASSTGNQLQGCVIKNAYRGISTKATNTNAPEISLTACIIENAFETGIESQNSLVRAENCLISNCGRNILISGGGTYSFTHCTLASYSTPFQLHKYPAAYISDAWFNNGIIQTNPLQASFVNCIFWGEEGLVDNEIISDKQSNQFSLAIDHCLFRAVNDPTNSVLNNVIRNQDPLFDSIDIANNHYDFHTRRNAAAPGIDAGIITTLTTDLDGNNRNVNLPDLGSFEKQ